MNKVIAGKYTNVTISWVNTNTCYVKNRFRNDFSNRFVACNVIKAYNILLITKLSILNVKKRFYEVRLKTYILSFLRYFNVIFEKRFCKINF